MSSRDEGGGAPPLPLWAHAPADRMIGRGHFAGDFLEAYEWRVLELRRGYMKLDVHLPAHLKNPRGQLFGGYTPTYVDLVALRTVHKSRAPGEPPSWLTTLSLRVDYLEPITSERFIIESEVVHQRRGTHFVEIRFRDPAGGMLAFCTVTLRDVARPHP